MKPALLTLFVCCVFYNLCQAQRNCGTDKYNDALLTRHPVLQGRVGISNTDKLLQQKLAALTGVINIPVSVHVVYHTAEQKITRQQMEAQINQLNNEFAGLNPDISGVPPCYKPMVAADCGIRFNIQKFETVYTTKEAFLVRYRDAEVDDPQADPIKFKNYGGVNGDANTQYLNIWIGNITDGSTQQLLGYGTFPGGINRYDGVVIYHKAIAPGSTLVPYHLGRTLTHEVGHWLNLRHIWGDRNCGDDLVSDTPQQYTSNGGVPTFPHLSPCGDNPDGDMFMNYMDYTDDVALLMFTKQQRNRMRSLFVEGGLRSPILYASKFDNLAGVDVSVRRDDQTAAVINIDDRLSASSALISKIVSWRAVDSASKYIVQTRPVGAENWNTTIVHDTKVELASLKAGNLYEVRLQTINRNGQKSAPGIPYVFSNIKK